MTGNASNFSVAQFLCGSSALFWISSIIFSLQFPLDLFATNSDVLRVQVFNSHARAVFVVLAVSGLGTRNGSYVANFDHLHVLCRRCAYSSNCCQCGQNC